MMFQHRWFNIDVVVHDTLYYLSNLTLNSKDPLKIEKMEIILEIPEKLPARGRESINSFYCVLHMNMDMNEFFFVVDEIMNISSSMGNT